MTRTVDSNGIVTRQLVIGPGLPPANSPVDLGYVYQFENGDLSQGVLHVTIVAVLSVTATATPPQIVSGQSTQLSAMATGGSPPYSYIWSPLVSSPSIPNPTATPNATTTFTVTVTDSPGLTASASVTVLVGGGLLPPVLTGISPALGLTAGGTFVTISGDNFLADATVQFGAAQAQAGSVVERDSRTLTAVTPPGSGTVDVTVTNLDNQAATLPGAFTYDPPSVITSVTATPPAVVPIATSQLFVTPAGGIPPYTFQWSSDPALSSVTSADPVASPSNPPVCCGSGPNLGLPPIRSTTAWRARLL